LLLMYGIFFSIDVQKYIGVCFMFYQPKETH
jgi:hypothetical protein